MTSATITLAGSPNCGKSALFNALTGSRQKVGNYPGVTVEKKLGFLKTPAGQSLAVIDLPGTYSLHPHSPDEAITVDILTGDKKSLISEGTQPMVVAVADATNLERTLGLALDLKNRGTLHILTLNMMDLAEKRGLRLNIPKLSQMLGVPVIPTVATKGQGISHLVASIESSLKELGHHSPNSQTQITLSGVEQLQARATDVNNLIAACVSKRAAPDKRTEQLDRILLHRFLGFPILAAILILIFQGVFTWAEVPKEYMEIGLALLGDQIRLTIPYPLISSLLVDGILAGVGAVLVFLPQILILFFFIFLLEGTGYMMRAAFLMDRIMASVGLQGKSFVPLLSSFACAIPGIMATRTIKNERDRLITMLIAPLMTCSARLPVYVLLIGAFVPNMVIYGPLKLQGLVMFGLFLLGILSAMAVAWVSQKLMPQKVRAPDIFDLPSYKWPSWKNIAWSLWQRGFIFVQKAGTFILVLSVVLWALASFPRPPEDWKEPAIHYSLAGRVGRLIEPLLAPIGFDWRIATGLIPGFAAREVMVGALGTVFAVESQGDNEEGEILSLQEKIVGVWGLPTALSLLIWYVFAPQCISTFAILRRESNSAKFSAMAFGYLLALAYLASWVTFHVTSLLF